MKSATTLLVGLVALLLLAITASLSLSADSFIAAYVELQTQPESVSDIVLRSRTTPSAPDPHRQSGMWFGAGLLAVALLFIASLLALMFGGGNLLRQWRLAFRRPRRHAAAPPHYQQPPYASLPPAPDESQPLLPARRTPPAEHLPPWSEDGF